MTNNDKTSSREAISVLLKADSPDSDRLRIFVADMLRQVARSGAFYLDSGSAPLPLPSGLLESIQGRPQPIVTLSPNWADVGPYAVVMANSVQGSNRAAAGFAAIITNANGEEKELSCWHIGASTQEAEARALIMGLESIPVGATATFTSTNRTTVRTFNEWMPKWKRVGWRNSAGQEPASPALWRKVDALALERCITLAYVAKSEAPSPLRRAHLRAQLALEHAIASDT